jgi:hypothetical protein
MAKQPAEMLDDATRERNAAMLRAAGDAVMAVDLRFHLAGFDEQFEMRDERDRAFNAFAAARNRLMLPGLAISEEEIAEVDVLRREVENAADTATLIAAAGKIALALLRLALV